MMRRISVAITILALGGCVSPCMFTAPLVRDSTVVTTLAGTGTDGLKDGPADQAQFGRPTGVASDGHGTIYVADSSNECIRKISPDGQVSVLCGGPVEGYMDGMGKDARFRNPQRLVIDHSGNLLVADTDNNLIRKVTPDGVVSTLAGDISGPPLGDFADGATTSARFAAPEGLAIDSNDVLYVADSGNQRIRKVLPTGQVSTFAGNGTAGFADGKGAAAEFDTPLGLALDASGSLYVADAENNRIRRVAPDGTVTTYAGDGKVAYKDGPAASAEFQRPEAVTVDPQGNVYVAGNEDLIRKITPSGQVTMYVWTSDSGFGDGTGAAVKFFGITDLLWDSGRLIVADHFNNRIRLVTRS